MNTQGLNGLEFMRNIVEGHISAGGMADVMNIKVVEVSRGYVKLHAKADKRHTNPFGVVHGGFAATVLDSVTASVVHTMLEAGIGFATVDVNTKLVSPVPLDNELVAEGRVIHLSRKIGISEGTLKDSQGNLYAHGTAIVMIKR